MRRKKDRDESEDTEEVEETIELSEKELKKRKLKEGVEKRKNSKKKDKIARWGGLILLGLIMFVGFLLWVSGEMKNDEGNAQMNKYTNTRVELRGSVIVK